MLFSQNFGFSRPFSGLFQCLCISFQNLYFLLQLIFVVGGVKESYNNLRTLFALLDLKASKNSKIVMDLKCANLALGLQTARAR